MNEVSLLNDGRVGDTERMERRFDPVVASEKSTARTDVVTVNYNCGDWLSASATAVLNSDCVSRMTVIDNASSDNSLDKLCADCEQDTRLLVIRNARNHGFATANNQAIRETDGEYILILNPDCIVDRTSICEMQRLMDEHPEAGVAGCLLLNTDGTEQAGGRRAVPTPWRSFVRAFGLGHFAKRWPKLYQDFNLHKQPLPLEPISVEAISGAFMMVRRSALRDVGLMDEEYFMHCEDLDWCMRFRKKKWKIIFTPHVSVVHIRGVSSRQRQLFVEWHKHKGMLRFYRKFFLHQYPAGLMWLVALGVWVRFCAVASYYAGHRLAVLFKK